MTNGGLGVRLLLVLLVIFLAVVALGFFTNRQLEASTGELLKHIDRIKVDLKSDDWEGAQAGAANLKKAWEKEANWWPMLLDHQEMDNIVFAMSRFREYVAACDGALSRGGLSELENMISHIPEREAVTLKNIF